MVKLRVEDRSLITTIATANENQRPKASSRSWMMRWGIRRYYRLVGAEVCSQCGQPLNRTYKLHPFAMPSMYGKGLWLKSDCECVIQKQLGIREQLAKVTIASAAQPVLPLALRNNTFANFRVDAFNQDAYTACSQFAKNFTKNMQGKGLLLCGRSGRGKTHLACAIINQLNTKFSLAFAHTPTLLEQIRKGSGDLEHLLEVDLLVLDDIGSERESDWALEKLLIIVDGRLNQLKSTIYTTNFDYNELELRLGSRLSSRILNNSLYILVQGPDWREVMYRQGTGGTSKKTMRQ